MMQVREVVLQASKISVSNSNGKGVTEIIRVQRAQSLTKTSFVSFKLLTQNSLLKMKIINTASVIIIA